jgi:hypothetical protein
MIRGKECKKKGKQMAETEEERRCPVYLQAFTSLFIIWLHR